MAVDWRPAQQEIVSQAFNVAQAYKANELGTVAKFRDVGSTDYGTGYFKYVQYEEGAVAADGVAGEAAYYYKLDGVKDHQVCSDASDSVQSGNILLGAGIMHSSPANNEYLWIQLTGNATLTVGLTGSPADGDALTATGAADGSLDIVDISSVTTANDCPIVARAGEAASDEILCSFPL